MIDITWLLLLKIEYTNHYGKEISIVSSTTRHATETSKLRSSDTFIDTPIKASFIDFFLHVHVQLQHEHVHAYIYIYYNSLYNQTDTDNNPRVI